jgi:neutral ceramidase
VPTSEPIAFNRTVDAYNANPDAESVTWDGRRSAVDRTSIVLRIDAEDGSSIGVINWFPLHGTSVHSDNTLIHPDNKGIAALRTEAALGGDAVAAYAQSAAGDVSPNFRKSKKRGLMIGVDDDDFESAAIAGEIQAKYAGAAHSAAQDEQPAVIDALTLNLDFRGAAAAPKYTSGKAGCITGGSRVGMTFIQGTAEGPGPLLLAPGITRGLSQLAKVRRGYKALRSRSDESERWRDVHGPKYPFLDTGLGSLGRAFGAFSASEPILPGAIDPVVQAVKMFGEIDAVSDREWAPNTLPLQILIIGRLAIVGAPTEPTTQAGRRIAKSVAEALADRVDHVVVNGYANGYAGYTATYEEYQLQRYEGASTLFGQWSLAVMQTTYDEIAARLSVPSPDRNWDSGAPIVGAPVTDIYSQVWLSDAD